MFSQKLNPVTGEYEWVAVDVGEGVRDEEASGKETGSFLDPSGAIQQSLYLDMLNDSWRNDAYSEAVRRSVRRGMRVLDIGLVYLLDPLLVP
jgi:hypothetical protein